MRAASVARRLWTAAAVSNIGDALTGTTVLLWMYDHTGGDGRWFTALLVAEFLPSLLLGTLIGRLADGLPQRATMIATDLARVVLTAALVLGMLTGAPAAVLLIMVPIGLSGLAFRSAQGSLLPDLFASDAGLTRMNASLTVVRQGTFIVGPGAAVGLYALAGFQTAILIDAATFLVSALILFTVRWDRPARAAAEAGETARPEAVPPPRRRSLQVAFIYCALSIAAGINGTIMVVFLAKDLGGHPGDVAWLAGANGAAQLIAGGAVIAWARKASPYRLLPLGLAVMGVLGIVLAQSVSILMAVIVVVANSFANSPVGISLATLMQRLAPVDGRARFLAVAEGVMGAAYLAGSVTGGLVATMASARAALWVSAAVLAVCALAGLAFHLGHVRDTRAAAPVPVES